MEYDRNTLLESHSEWDEVAMSTTPPGMNSVTLNGYDYAKLALLTQDIEPPANFA